MFYGSLQNTFIINIFIRRFAGTITVNMSHLKKYNVEYLIFQVLGQSHVLELRAGANVVETVLLCYSFSGECLSRASFNASLLFVR